jgi:hypothetical protein
MRHSNTMPAAFNEKQLMMIQLYQEQVRRNKINKSLIAKAVGLHGHSYVSRTLKEWRDRMKAKTMRECLLCEQPFPSHGKHDRLCNACGQESEYVPYSLSFNNGGHHAGQ